MTELATTGDLTAYQAGDPALLLTAAEAAVRTYCGWHIAPSRTDTLTVDGSGSSVLALPTLYLTAVASITEDGDAVDMTSVDWSTSGVLWRDRPWSSRRRGVAATVTHGYAEPPAEVTAVVLAWAARAKTAPQGIRSETVGSMSVTYTDGVVMFAAEERAILDRYRIPNGA